MAMIDKAVVLGLTAGFLFAFNPLATAQEEKPAAVAQVEAPERDSYLNDLKRRHGTKDERTALLAESNKLLGDYAFKAGYQLGQQQHKREDLSYRLTLGSAGELVVREERRSASGVLTVRNQNFQMFGTDPFIRYDCTTGQQQSCVLFNPKDGNPWLTIVRHRQGAEQLTRALGFLILNLQKG